MTKKEIEQALTEYIKRTGKGYFDGAVEEAVLREESLSREEQDENEDELIRIMHDKFIKGEDKAFNYRTVDENEAYDDVEQINKDLEESYFDSEEPYSFSVKSSIYTGEQDF